MKNVKLVLLCSFCLMIGGCELWEANSITPNSITATTAYVDSLNAQATTVRQALDALQVQLVTYGVLDANSVAKYIRLTKEMDRITTAITNVSVSIAQGDYQSSEPGLITGLRVAQQTNAAIPSPWQAPIAGALALITGVATWLWRKKVGELDVATGALKNVVVAVEKSSQEASKEIKSLVKNTNEEKALVTSLKPAA